MPLKRKPGHYEKLLSEGTVEDKTGCKENICEKYVLTGETQEVLLPINAKLWVAMGLVKKKELLRVEVSSPHYRHELSLPLVNNEVLVSEIYMLSSTLTSEVKKMIRLCIPFSDVNIKRYIIKAYTRQSRDHFWDEIECSIKVIDDKELLGEILLDNFGHFILTSFPKYDPFNLIPSGCIFYARLSRYVSIRCPRFTVETPVGCNLQIIPILRTTLEYCQDQYSTRCEELLECSEMVVLSSEYKNDFRRPLTLKLPLPELLDTTLEETRDDIGVVARKPDDKQWYLIENQYQFTRNSVSVDTTHLGMFVVGRSAPGKKKRIKDSVQILEEKLDVFLGTITMFIRFQEDQWVVVIACHTHSNIEQLELKWKERNFIRITADVADDMKYQTLAASEKYSHFQGNKCIELKNNQSWAISVFGSLKVSDEEEEYNQLVYHQGLKENYKVFSIQPAHEEVTRLIGIIEISPEHIDSSDFWKLSAVFPVEVPKKVVENYWSLKQEEKEKELKIVALQEQQQRKQQQLEQQQQEQLQRQLQRQQWEQFKQKQQLEMSEILKMPTPESINNLSRPLRVQEVERQRNVLTGRSLMAMSELIHDPIALATFLKLPHTTIQAIGFDSIAINYSAKAKSYRVLLHWKRFFCPKGGAAVEDLVNAFKEIRLDALAEAVQYHDSLNKEMNIQSIKLCMEPRSGWK